jgi:hypothetical protein
MTLNKKARGANKKVIANVEGLPRKAECWLQTPHSEGQARRFQASAIT